MFATVTILIVIAAIIIVVASLHTRGHDYEAPKPKIADEQLTTDDVAGLFDGTTLTTRAGYLHYDLSETYQVDDKHLGVFTGHVKPDPQHDGDIFVYDDDGNMRGKILSQRAYYATLLNRRRANCYGFVTKESDGDYHGEVCVRNI